MFYQSIAKVYDHIFPQNLKQRTFIENIRPLKTSDAILDVGCATGNLTALLAERSQGVIGLDLDHDLLLEAKEKHPSITFKEMNMLEIWHLNTSFDLVVSFGNTLVHLPSLESIETFFHEVYRTLKPGGHFMVQIINYDRILDQVIDHLPTIDNETIKFVRKYEIEGNHVSFITDLTIKETGQNIHNRIPLLAIRKLDILTRLEAAGFVDIEFYGDLNGNPLDQTSIPLLFSCKRSL